MELVIYPLSTMIRSKATSKEASMEREAMNREFAGNEQRAQLLARGEPGALVVRHVGAENGHDLAATLATLHPRLCVRRCSDRARVSGSRWRTALL